MRKCEYLELECRRLKKPQVSDLRFFKASKPLDEAQNREPYKVELTNAIEEERAAWLSAVQGA